MATKKPDSRAQLEARKKELEAQVKQTKDLEQQKILKHAISDINDKLAEDGEAALRRVKEEKKIAEKVLELTGKKSDLNKAIIDEQEALLQIEQEKLAIQIKQLETGEATEEEIAATVAQIQTYQKILEQVTDTAQEHADQISNAGDLAKNLGASIGLASKYQETFMGKMSSTLDGLANNVEAQKEFKNQLKETFHPMNLLSSLASKIFQSTMLAAASYDQAAASFNAATGAAGEYNKAIEEASRGATSLGVSTADAGAAMGALHANMSGFTNLSKDTAATLAQGTAALEKLGISSATTAKNIDMLGKHMGLSAEAALDQQNKMAEFAAGIGVSSAKMAEDFGQATSLMVQYGADGERMFKNLAKTAKSTGIEMQTLLGIVGKFDTFEGAGEAAGKLNAILGGPLLNSVELLTASEDERVAMLQEAVAMSGKSWEAMNKYEKQSLMAAAGISDLDTAGRLFGNNSEEVTQKQKDLNKMIETSQTVVQKLELIMRNFAIMIGPLVDRISNLATGINKLFDEYEGLGTTLKWVTGIFATLMVLWKGFVAVTKLQALWSTIAAAATVKQGLANIALGSSAGPASAGIVVIGQAAAVSWKYLLAFGAAALMVGAGIALAALGIAELVKSFAELSGEQMINAVAMIATFTASLLLLGSFGVPVAIGLGAIALGLGGIAAALLLIKTEDIVALGELGKALSNMTVERSIAFKASMEGFESALDVADDAGVSTLVGAAEFIKLAGFIPRAAGAEKKEAVPVKIVGGGGRTAAAGAGVQGSTTVKLILNDREFAKAVINVMENRVNLKTG